jgi:3-hydroxyisobutyrate dehydrogenase
MGFEFAPGKTRIGWVGTGVMGTSMCGHLIAAGYQATIYNRSVEKTRALAARGAAVAASVAELAAASDVVFTIVGYPRDVREVTLGPQGVVASARPGTVVVDMTTSEPGLAVEIFESAKLRNLHAVDAPVSGGTSARKRPGCRS